MTVSPSVCPHHIHSRCFWWEIVRPAGLLESKNQQQSRVFFDVIFDAYNHVDNRERARASDCKQKRCRNFVGRKTWKFGSGGEKMRNARGGQQEAATESGSRKKLKAIRNSTYNNSSTKKCVTRKFHVLVVKKGIVVMQNNGKEMYKKVCCTCKFVFC